MTKTIKAAKAETATKTVDAFVTAGKDAAEAMMKAGSDAYAKGYEKAFAMTKENVDAAVKGYADIAAFGKGNVEAAVAAGNVVAKGFEQLSAEMLSLTKASIEETVAAAKKVMGAKTLKEVMDLQSDFAKHAFDGALANSAKFSEMAVKAVNESYAPIQARVNVAVEKFVKPIAA
ncbi:MAG: hypothetical protein FJX47_13895 [Alphaproteobacteria bacterium]|nr:hypothetical protein [Alphaproteobacteria bacterium]